MHTASCHRRVVLTYLTLTACIALFGTPGSLAAQTTPFQAPITLTEWVDEPPPVPSCHASTIVETPGGLVAAWFAGTDEGETDVGIWFARRIDGKWTTPRELVKGNEGEDKDYPCWNPVLFQPAKGPLMLFYKVGPSPSTWWGALITSTDGGVTWSTPTRLPEGILGPIKNKPIQLASGDILCGTSSEHDGWRVYFERTKDFGKTWTTTPTLNDGHDLAAIQPSILVHSGGKLQAVGRTKNGKVFETWSTDDGLTWSPLALLNMPNPNAGTDAVTLSGGTQLLVYNHTPKGRSPLNVAISADGKQWQAVAVLESEPGEFSYPAVIQTTDGKVHITYTWKRKRIRHVELDPAKFAPRDIVDGAWPKD